MPVQVVLRKDAGKLAFPPDPWIRKRSVARVLGPPDPRALACVVDHKDTILGWGTYSPESEIPVRLLMLGEAAPPEHWLAARIRSAIAARSRLGLGVDTTGYREINSEGDGLPGLVVDRYDTVRVVQLTTAPMVARRDEILAVLALDAPEVGLLWLAPEGAAVKEGFEAGTGYEQPGADGPAPTELDYREHGLSFCVPAPPAQKTGAYHDQRDNRALLAQLAARAGGDAPATMLDLGCHVGGFAIHAAQAGVNVVAVDRSTAALAHAAQNARRNGVEDRIRFVQADMFSPLDAPELEGPFDLIVFDPPKIASSRRDVPKAVGAMQRTSVQLLTRLREHGRIALCSCSQHLDGDALDRVAAGAAAKTGRPLTRVLELGAGEDHPVWPGHPQGAYLRVRVYQRR